MPLVKVWAPKPKEVGLSINGIEISMSLEKGGWWRAETPLAIHGADYGFRLDGSRPLPDPRSPWQPNGVHGLSRFYDHSRFKWTDAHRPTVPPAGGIIYEIHIGAFTPEGTFDAAVERLDHLTNLGVTHVELMPVVEFPGSRGWGYDGVDLYAPHHSYGGPDGLKRFVNACHRRGLAVILDVVYNHLGPDGSCLDRFGWYVSDRHRTPWGEAINFDGRDSGEVRRFFLDNARMWVQDYHIDGLRLDAVHAIVDLGAYHFLEQLADEFEVLKAQTGLPLTLIAESDLNDPRLLRSAETGGYGLDAQWDDDFRHALWTVLSGERDGFLADYGSLADLAQAYDRIFVYAGRYSNHRRRRHGRPPFGIDRRRFVAYLQNHDQVGNRPAGDRPTQVLSLGGLKIAAASLLTSPFTPMLFMGEEWAAETPFLYFTDHTDERLVQAVRQGRIREFAAFGWQPEQIPDPQAPATALRSKLGWDELEREPHASMLDWYRKLIRLRLAHPALSAGGDEPIQIEFSEGRRWLLIEREALGEQVIIAVNFSSRPEQLPRRPGPDWEILLASEKEARLEHDAILLPPESVAVIRRR